MKFIDIHTHQKIASENTIINCPIDEAEDFVKQFPAQFISLGLHPWDAGKDNVHELEMVDRLGSLHQVVFIGECGLDRLRNVPFAIQENIFIEQVNISEKHRKPLIIHCVKAYDELIFWKKKLNPAQAWIIHGFRGKKELAGQLVKHGFYLSFGKGIEHVSETIQAVPLDRLFLETDDLDIPVEEIYREAAQLLNLKPEVLAIQIKKNFNKIVRE